MADRAGLRVRGAADKQPREDAQHAHTEQQVRALAACAQGRRTGLLPAEHEVRLFCWSTRALLLGGMRDSQEAPGRTVRYAEPPKYGDASHEGMPSMGSQGQGCCKGCTLRHRQQRTAAMHDMKRLGCNARTQGMQMLGSDARVIVADVPSSRLCAKHSSVDLHMGHAGWALARLPPWCMSSSSCCWPWAAARCSTWMTSASGSHWRSSAASALASSSARCGAFHFARSCGIGRPAARHAKLH